MDVNEEYAQARNALAVSGGPKLLEEDNQHKGRFRRALAALFSR